MDATLIDLTLTADSPKLSPEDNVKIPNHDELISKLITWPARKIVLGIIEWFSYMTTPLDHIKYLLIWSSSNHLEWIEAIKSIYPTITIHVYGETKYDSDDITITRRLFNNDDLQMWFERKDETAILGMYPTMDQMRSWIASIKPIESFVYFKTITKQSVFLKGHIFFPVWDKAASNYAWIHPQKYKDKYVAMTLDDQDWKNTLYYHNNITRILNHYPNILNVRNKKAPIYPEAGLTNNFDSYAEYAILNRFFYQFTLDNERSKYLKAMVDTISNLLTRGEISNNRLLK